MLSMAQVTVLFFAFTSTGALGADTVYKVVDDDGTVRYTDTPPTGSRVTDTLEFRHLPSSPLSESTLRFRADIEKRISARAAQYREPQQGEVRLFSAEWCPHCKRAKAALAKQRISYIEYNIDTPDGMAAFIRASGRSVPLLVTSRGRVAGYSDASYDRILAAEKK